MNNIKSSFNKKMFIFIGILILIVGVIFFKSINTFKVSDNKVMTDMIGKKINLLSITKDNLKSLKITNQKQQGNILIVTADVDIQYTEKGAGQLNKYMINNDIFHHITGTINLNYSKNDNAWGLDDNINFASLNDNKKEVATTLKEIQFKSDKEILQDLKDKNIGINSSNISFAVTFGKDDFMGYVPINNLSIFKIDNIETKDTIYKIATISVDGSFSRTKGDSEDGNYSINGQFKVLYKLGQYNNGNEAWIFSSISDTSNLKINKA